MRWLVAGASIVGQTHLLDDLPNQDAILYKRHQQNWIVSVADGLGSKPYSQIGSKLACRASQFFWQNKLSLKRLHQYWCENLGHIPPNQASTTLLTAYVFLNQAHILQLGDGLILGRSGGQVLAVSQARDDYLNQTNCLSTHFNTTYWQQCTLPLFQAGDGLILMTDGIADDIEPQHYASFFETIYQTFQTRSHRRQKGWLKKELSDWATPLSGDDKSLVAIFRNQ